ncbi:hypothetical protein AXG93_3271s1440 [Marchantia polymorpha subsp. ruderalis]|uniref:DUF676 domain-containing protein n=1 Tax=Marchantia polymorpha subsp. ruderalis TaxID=1480154 RepID=A0A176VPJ2_MARPO|nr:hypothetical protein AXG93_3271s1440 [Marchantia polymorpha subsp. ruderalis]
MWSKPVVLVGHSLGGIVIKELLLEAHDIAEAGSGVYDTRKVKDFLDNIILIYYYSTPHFGMTLRVGEDFDGATWKNARIMNPYLSRLQQEFKQLNSLYRKWRKATIGESYVTKWGSERLKIKLDRASIAVFNAENYEDHILRLPRVSAI